MRTIHASLIPAKNALDSSAAWLRLLDVVINSATTVHLVANPASVTFGGTTYVPFPFTLGEIQSDSRGGLNEVEVIVSNVTRDMSAYIEANDLRGQRVRYRGVQSANLDNPSKTAFDEEYEIGEISVTEQAVTFRLTHERLLQQQFPSARLLRDNCRWIYKSVECGYIGGLTACDKILNSSNGCRTHGNQARFGGFPALPVIAG